MKEKPINNLFTFVNLPHSYLHLTIVLLGFMPFISLGLASPFDDYWHSKEVKLAPMIEAFQGLKERSKSAFDELDNELNAAYDDEEQVSPKHKPKTKVKVKAKAQTKVKSRREKLTPTHIHTKPKREQISQSDHRNQQKDLNRQSKTPNPSRFEAEVLSLVNQERAQGGRCGSRSFKPSPPLSYQANLAQAAKKHALDMSINHYFSHSSQNGDSPTDRIKSTGYRGRAWGENIAAGQRSPKEVVQAWMDSPGHCANILNSLFTELGVSFIFDDQSPYKTYWVQAFGRPLR